MRSSLKYQFAALWLSVPLMTFGCAQPPADADPESGSVAEGDVDNLPEGVTEVVENGVVTGAKLVKDKKLNQTVMVTPLNMDASQFPCRNNDACKGKLNRAAKTYKPKACGEKGFLCVADGSGAQDIFNHTETDRFGSSGWNASYSLNIKGTGKRDDTGYVTLTLSGDANASGAVWDNGFNIFHADAMVLTTNSVSDDSRYEYNFVLGDSKIYEKKWEGKKTWREMEMSSTGEKLLWKDDQDIFEKTWRFPIGPVPCILKVALLSEEGVAYAGQFKVGGINGYVRPYVKGMVRVSAGGGVDLLSAGLSGQVTLLELSAPVHGDFTWYLPDACSGKLTGRSRGQVVLASLEGHVDAYVESCLKAKWWFVDINECARFSQNLGSWKGFRKDINIWDNVLVDWTYQTPNCSR